MVKNCGIIRSKIPIYKCLEVFFGLISEVLISKKSISN